MPIDIHTLLADSTVATAPSPATTGTSLTLATGEGARFPSTGSFDVLICPPGAVPIWASGAVTGGNFETCRATRSGDVLTLTRAQYSTTARTVVVGDRVFQPVMPHDLTDISPAYSTSLPSSPSDGQMTIFVDSATNPTFQWWLRYNAGSSSAYKWEFVGGSPAYAIDPSVVTPASTGWQGSYGPGITVARAGEYFAGWEVSVQVATTAILFAATVGLSSPADNTPPTFANVAAGGYASVGRSNYGVTLAATNTIGFYLYTSVANAAPCSPRIISLVPRRIS